MEQLPVLVAQKYSAAQKLAESPVLLCRPLLLLLSEQSADCIRRISLCCGLGVSQCTLRNAARHSFHVGNKVWIRRSSLNRERDATLAAAQCGHLRQSARDAALELGQHLEVQRPYGTHRPGSGDDTDR